jgi:hypothetical protein
MLRRRLDQVDRGGLDHVLVKTTRGTGCAGPPGAAATSTPPRPASTSGHQKLTCNPGQPRRGHHRKIAGARRPGRPTLTGMQTTATFRLFSHAALTAAAVTRRLAIQPTRALEAGDPISSRSARTRDSSAWLLSSSPGIEDGTELTGHLHRLLATLEPVTAPLWELVHEGYEANWFCYIASHATEHAAELDRATLQRLLALPGDLWLDVCDDGADHQ